MSVEFIEFYFGSNLKKNYVSTIFWKLKIKIDLVQRIVYSRFGTTTGMDAIKSAAHLRENRYMRFCHVRVRSPAAVSVVESLRVHSPRGACCRYEPAVYAVVVVVVVVVGVVNNPRDV